ncbi:MAG: ATP-binding protein, partial [Cyclobacteriaceae bacterium]
MDLRKKTKEMEIAEIRLKASEANYKLLFESNPLPKILLDIETLEILEVNVAAEEKYGYAKSDLKGKNMGVLNLPDKRITLKGNQNALYRLFLNLTSNALKFILENRTPEVTINCEDQNSKWQFSVSDNGIGIDKDYLPTLFEPFNRINDKQTEGTGLGLATCKKIVDQHGGKIWVDSIPGKGSQ